MLKLVIILLGCGLYQDSFAQENETAFLHNKKVTQRTINNFQSIREVAAYYRSNFTTEKDQIKGIYYWVTRNIRYDKTGTYALNAGPDKQAKIDVAFALRRGVCENFSAIFNDICLKAGFESYMIEGITRINMQIIEGAHSWTTVKVNDEWTFFDPTWDAGGGTAWFMVQPEEFIKTHIPFDPLWQFLLYPEQAGADTKKERSAGKPAPFHYTDSLMAWIQMDSIGKLESAERRILHLSSQNKNSKNNLAVVKMNLEIERQGEQVKWHDEATAHLNMAVALMNQFITCRNDLSLLKKEDAELKNMLANALSYIDLALTFLDKIDQSKATLVMGTWPERERITKMKINLRAQQEFLSRYLSTNAAERKQLFYK